VKIKIVGSVEDMSIWGLAGDKHSTMDESPLTADNWPEGTGESEYMLFDMDEAWTGLIDKFAFEFINPTPDTVIYVEEIALFADQATAYEYAGREIVTEPEATEAPETNAPETNASVTEGATQGATEPTTEAPVESGCASVVGFGAVAVLAAAAAFVALKKKD